MGNLTRISGSLIANYSSSITGTGSFGSLAVSDKVQGTLTLNSNLTGSLTSTGSFGSLNATHLNGILEGTLGPVANALISGSTVVNAPNISGSITSTGSFGSLVVVDKVQGNLTLGGNLLASGDLDIGSHGFRAATLTADGLTAGRVPFAGTAGLLSDDSDLTFSGDTLTATKISATQITATGDISTSGSIFAREFHTEFTSASVTFASGSNKFGDDSGDTHRVTGSLLVSGSITMAHGDLTVTDNLDIEGDVDINGTTNLDNTDIDGNLDISGNVTGSITSTSSFASAHFMGTGGVGIGTNNPATKLQIGDGTAGDNLFEGIRLRGGSDAAKGASIGFMRGSTSTFFIGDLAGLLGGSENRSDATIYASTGNAIRFFTNGNNERMVVSSSGEVGIGSSSPTAKLDVNGGAVINGDTIIGRGGNQKGKLTIQSRTGTATRKTNAIVAVPYNDASESICMIGMDGQAGNNEMHIGSNTGDFMSPTFIDFFTATSVTNQTNNRAMRITSDQKVGIGTDNPTKDLHIDNQTNTAGCNVLVQSNNSNGWVGSSLILNVQNAVSRGAGVFMHNEDADKGFYAGVIYNVSFDRYSICYEATATQTQQTAATDHEIVQIQNDGDYLSTTGTDIQQISDRRLKENIQDFTGGLDVLKNLQPRTFEWKEGRGNNRFGRTGTQYGFIAQEIESGSGVVDNMNLYKKVDITDGELDSDILDGTKYQSQLNAKDALYISAIKELSEKIERLESQISGSN